MLIRIEKNPMHKFAHKSYGLKQNQKMVCASETLLASGISIKESCDILHVLRCFFYRWKKTVTICKDEGMRSSASSHTALTSKISVNGEVLVSAKTTVAIEPIAMTVATEPAITNKGILTNVFNIITVTVVNQLPPAVPTP